jgi:hypothetical protein
VAYAKDKIKKMAAMLDEPSSNLVSGYAPTHQGINVPVARKIRYLN